MRRSCATLSSKSVSAGSSSGIWVSVMDIVSSEVRSRMMAGIRDSNTVPEMRVRRMLHRHGFRYRLHQKNFPREPDVARPRHRVCVLIHGCVWHKHPACKYATTPKIRAEFWKQKFERELE
ncbi:very short patch repair endonuclease, partial [Pseudomonas protegens]|uniref:very short patch repair endonuclease n=1 Tax=Pseudomonas protegens TaxID=380021 RepID=UPI003D0A143F